MRWAIIITSLVIVSLIFGILLDRYDNSSLNDFEESTDVFIDEDVDKEVLVLDLNLEDFSHIERRDGKVFVIRHGVNRELKFSDYEVMSVALSPNKDQFAFTYNSDVGSWVVELRVANLSGEKSGEVIDQFTFAHRMPAGYLSWISSRYIHMMRGCGTGCTELILVDLAKDEVKSGAVFHEYYLENGEPFAKSFVDWFGIEHEIDYVVGDVRMEIKDNKPYLVLEKMDRNQKKYGEEKYLFDGESLMKIE